MLVTLLIGLIVIALIYWAITYLPLPPVVKQVGTVVLVIVAALWLIGLLTGRNLVSL